MESNGVMLYQCTRCEEYKEKEKFYVNRAKPDGYTNYCKECELFTRKTKLGLNDSPKTDREKAENILRALGYNVEENIHEQFMKRFSDKLNNLKQ